MTETAPDFDIIDIQDIIQNVVSNKVSKDSLLHFLNEIAHDAAQEDLIVPAVTSSGNGLEHTLSLALQCIESPQHEEELQITATDYLECAVFRIKAKQLGALSFSAIQAVSRVENEKHCWYASAATEIKKVLQSFAKFNEYLRVDLNATVDSTIDVCIVIDTKQRVDALTACSARTTQASLDTVSANIQNICFKVQAYQAACVWDTRISARTKAVVRSVAISALHENKLLHSVYFPSLNESIEILFKFLKDRIDYATTP